MRSATGQQRTNSQPTAQSSSVGGGPVTPGGRGQYNANATTPGTASQLQPRQPGASNSGGTAGGRPTTPRRLSPINTGGVKDTSAYKGTLSPKAGGGGSTSFASNSKASLSPTRASGARGPRSGARIVSSSTSSTSSTSSSTSSTNRGGASTTTSGAGAGAGGALNRVARPAPISTQNKWTRNSPPSNTQDEDESTGTIGIEEMRAQRRVFRLAAQMPEQALGGGGGTTNSSAGSAPPPLNLSKKKKKTAAASSSGGGSSNSNSKQKVRSTTRGNSYPKRRKKPKKIRKKPINYVKMLNVKDIHLIGILKKIPKRLIRKVNGRNAVYVTDILMMMDLVIYYLYKKNQTIKKQNVIYVERQKILFR